MVGDGLSIHVCTYTLATVLWVSDMTTVLLSSYKQWVDGAVFYPKKGLEVRVTIKDGGSFTIPTCQLCEELMKQSHISKEVGEVNWKRIDCFDLTSVVSCTYLCIDKI